MNYNELDYDESYSYEQLLEWWGADEMARRRKSGDIYETDKGIYRRLE